MCRQKSITRVAADFPVVGMPQNPGPLHRAQTEGRPPVTEQGPSPMRMWWTAPPADAFGHCIIEGAP